MGAAFEAEAAHLKPAHCEFLAHWMGLLALEESGVAFKRAEIWQMAGGAPAPPAICICARGGSVSAMGDQM